MRHILRDLADLEGAHDSICNLEKMEDPFPATQSFIGDSKVQGKSSINEQCVVEDRAF